MSHDVFISHSSLDKLQADAICHGLEAKGIRCWIAPRDQIAGKPYGEQITEAIESADVMVLVFSDNVNRSQAVLNEINIAAGSDVTIVPFRIASVEFNPELHFYLGRMHWLDAFPQPVDTYIDTLATTVRRNLRHTPPPPDPTESDAGGLTTTGGAATTEPPLPPPAPSPPPPPVPPLAGGAAIVATAAPKTSYTPLLIAGGVFAGVVLLAIIISMTQKPPAAPAPAGPATPFMANAAPAPATPAAAAPAQNAGAAPAPTVGAQPPAGNGSELTPVNPDNPASVNYYETVLTADGPPAALQGASIITTTQLIAAMRNRDAGANPFWLIDARGCDGEQSIPTSVCMNPNNLQTLEAKVPNKASRIVVFCHDGTCPMSYQMATQAVAAGYTSIYWYRGGINAWTAAGEPSVTQAEADSD
jgi:rhodanese-related sulfurtransferase